jgi:hypothetical protein
MGPTEEESLRIEHRIQMEEQPKKIATAVILGLIAVACLAYVRQH